MDINQAEALYAAAVADGATPPPRGSTHLNQWVIQIVEAWSGTPRSGSFNFRLVKALESVASRTAEGAFGDAVVMLLEAKAGAVTEGAWNQRVMAALTTIGSGSGGVPARLTVDGSGSQYVLGDTPWTAWNGTYPVPAFSAGLSVVPAESTPATAQKIMGTDAATRGHFLFLQAIDGAIYVNAAQTTNGATYRRSAAGVLTSGNETRLAFTRGNDTLVPDVYVDGVKVVGTTGSVTDIGGANRFEVIRLGGAGFTSFDYFNGGVRAHWFVYGVKLSDVQIAALDALIADEDHAAAAAYVKAIDSGAVYLEFKTSDNGANGGSIDDLNDNDNGTPIGTVAEDLAAVA